MDITHIDFPKANSTFIVNKKNMDNIDECLSPQMLSIENGLNIKPVNPNETYNKSTSSTTMNIQKKLDSNNIIPKKSSVLTKNNLSTTKLNSKKKRYYSFVYLKCLEHNYFNIGLIYIICSSDEHQIKNKQREKLEDIDVNIENQSSQHITRTMKRKLQEENQIAAKKSNVVHVPLEKKLTPFKQIEDVLQTPHQIRENEAEKRKELYLKSKADQKYIN